jgi:hypothetical protein
MRAYAYIVPWLVSHFAALAAPTDGATLVGRASSFVKRAPKDAGIGVELEVRNFVLSNEDPRAKNADDKMKAAIKGSTLLSVDLPIDMSKTCAPFWDLTAESLGTEGKF